MDPGEIGVGMKGSGPDRQGEIRGNSAIFLAQNQTNYLYFENFLSLYNVVQFFEFFLIFFIFYIEPFLFALKTLFILFDFA